MNCIYVDLPTKVRGCVVPNPDGSFTVVLNSKFTHEMNVQTYLHEVEEHIRRGDFDTREADVQRIESEAHHTAPAPKKRKRRSRFDRRWREFQELHGWIADDKLFGMMEDRRLEE